jgi:tyrosine-protein phosphatase SIW14
MNHHRRDHRLWFTALAAMLVLTGVAVSVTQDRGPAAVTKNFGKVNENYYRGSQPTNADVVRLKSLGIKTVIDLRKDKEAKEQEWVRAAGMQYFNIPLKASEAANDEQTDYFLKLVNDPANWPVYVHCKGGRHRTGALTAVYRMTHDGWSADRAFAEMKQYDFDSGLFGGPKAQKKFVYAYEKQHARRIGQK